MRCSKRILGLMTESRFLLDCAWARCRPMSELTLPMGALPDAARRSRRSHPNHHTQAHRKKTHSCHSIPHIRAPASRTIPYFHNPSRSVLASPSRLPGMPARPLSLTMTADEILAHQRERNRVKQKAFKGRQRAAKLAQQQHQQPEVQPPASERSNSSGELGRRGVTVFSPESPSFPVTPENEDEGEDGDLGVKKLAKRIAELEEGARMLKRTRVERARVGEDLEREDHLEGVEGLSGCEFSSSALELCVENLRLTSSRPSHPQSRATRSLAQVAQGERFQLGVV